MIACIKTDLIIITFYFCFWSLAGTIHLLIFLFGATRWHHTISNLHQCTSLRSSHQRKPTGGARQDSLRSPAQQIQATTECRKHGGSLLAAEGVL